MWLVPLRLLIAISINEKYIATEIQVPIIPRVVIVFSLLIKLKIPSLNNKKLLFKDGIPVVPP